MTIYYVRRSGSDAAAGTSAGAAWATIGKALGASGIASGDTVYIGAGIYREAVTVSVTPTVTTNVIGDVDGSKTGDAGEVRLTAFGNPLVSAAGTPLTITGKNFLSFSNICFQATWGSAALTGLTGHDTSFTDCSFTGGVIFNSTFVVDVAANITFERCRMLWMAGSGITIGLPTSTVADYNANVLIRNCFLWCVSTNTDANVIVGTTGANAFKGGGVALRSCTSIGAIAFFHNTANVSTTYPSTIYDCLLICRGVAMTGNVAGSLLEDYNIIQASTPRATTTAGTHSVTGLTNGVSFHFGQETIWGGQLRPPLTPQTDGGMILGFGAQTSPAGPSVDILSRPRPGGTNKVLATGTATAGAATTLTDSGAAFGTNTLIGAVCKLTGGTGSGQTKIIKSNTGTALTFYGNWKTNPDNTSAYAIYFGTTSETFTCTSGSTTTAVQSSASWVTNMWAGFVLEVTAGTGSGQTTTITSNTGTTLTVATLGTGLDNTSQCVVYRQTSVNAAANKSAGCFERHDTAEKETTITDAGGVSIRLTGWADQAVAVPVDATSTTISIRAYYDADHGSTNKPQAILDANGEVGVTTQTLTMSVAAGNWETLTFTPQTPTAKGWVVVRLVSRSDVPIGHAYFDTLGVV